MARKLLLAAISICACALLPHGTPPAHAQEQARVAGALVLIAAAELDDSNFGRSVVLVTRTPTGEMVGVILNRPTRQPWPDGVRGGAGESGRVHFGGPLAVDTLFAVGAVGAAGAVANTLDLGEGLRFAAGIRNVVALSQAQADPAASLKLFRGYAGWSPGQLEAEIAAGAWQAQKAGAALIFDADPATQWQRLNSPRRAVRGPAGPPRALQAGLGFHKVHPVDRLHADVLDLGALQYLQRHGGAALAHRPELFVKRFQ